MLHVRAIGPTGLRGPASFKRFRVPGTGGDVQEEGSVTAGAMAKDRWQTQYRFEGK